MSKNAASKAQLEVWSWKEALHDEIKDMTLRDGIRHLLKKGSDYRKVLESEGKLPTRQPHKKNH